MKGRRLFPKIAKIPASPGKDRKNEEAEPFWMHSEPVKIEHQLP